MAGRLIFGIVAIVASLLLLGPIVAAVVFAVMVLALLIEIAANAGRD